MAAIAKVAGIVQSMFAGQMSHHLGHHCWWPLSSRRKAGSTTLASSSASLAQLASRKLQALAFMDAKRTTESGTMQQNRENEETAEYGLERAPLSLYRLSVPDSSFLRSCIHYRKPLPHLTGVNNFSMPVVFFDLDNTLYPKSAGIAELMAERIELYFHAFLQLPLAESRELGRKYYMDYGLAIKGLVKHFDIEPVEYDAFVDGGLPLQDLLQPSEQLKKLLRDIRAARKYVFTNAGRNHAKRVMKLLDIEDEFEGVVYCDYSEPDFPSKPSRLAYERAMMCAGITKPSCCYFVDDSGSNVRTARELGWHALHLDEAWEDESKTADDNIGRIRALEDIRWAFPELFTAGLRPAFSKPIDEQTMDSEAEDFSLKKPANLAI